MTILALVSRAKPPVGRLARLRLGGLASAILLLPWSPALGTPFLRESWTSSSQGNPAAGLYRWGDLNTNNNPGVAGGSVVGFSSTRPWSVNTGLIRVVLNGLSSGSHLPSGGALAMAGQDDTLLRYAIREFSPGYAPTAQTYFSVSFRAGFLDDNGLSLAAITDSTSTTARTAAIAANTGTFYRGLAVGLKGNGSGGMDAILRFRNNSMTYVDQILVPNLPIQTTSTFVVRIAWNVANSSGTTTGTLDRDRITVWVNPASSTEPATATFTTLAELGDNTTANVLDTLHLLQQSFGRGSADLVWMDEIRVADSWADLGLQPPPELVEAPGHSYSAAVRSDATVVGWGQEIPTPRDFPSAAKSGVRARVAGHVHFLALKTDGTVLGWGENLFGQATVPSAAQTGVIAVAAGWDHSLALKTNGEVLAWGYPGSASNLAVPTSARSGVIAVAAGASHALALKTNGTVVAWGRNGDGQTTVPNSATSGVVAVAAGHYHSLALKTNGSVLAWGRTNEGQVSIPTNAQSGVVAVAAGAYHSLALREDGSVVVWGSTNESQLALPSAAQSGVVGVTSGFPVDTAAPALAAAEEGMTAAARALWTGDFSRAAVAYGSAPDGGSTLQLTAADGQASFVQRQVQGPAVVDFSWRTSSQANQDRFELLVNGVSQAELSGQSPWESRSITLGAGTHQVRWVYTKDASGAAFDDAAYLDGVRVLEAYEDLEVSLEGFPLSGSLDIAYGQTTQGASPKGKTFSLANRGTLPLTVTLSLPAGTGFSFPGGALTATLQIARGQTISQDILLATTTTGSSQAALGILAAGRTAPPQLRLTGLIQGASGPYLTLSHQGVEIPPFGALPIELGFAPAATTLLVTNLGDETLQVTGFQSQPAGYFGVAGLPLTLAPGASGQIEISAHAVAYGVHDGSVQLASSDPDLAWFTVPLRSWVLVETPTGRLVDGSVQTTGTAEGWTVVPSTTLADGSTGPALKTGATPDEGESSIGASFVGPGVLAWKWRVSSETEFDWLICTVNGREVAAISETAGPWRSQVVPIPADGEVNWKYLKDSLTSAGEDAGYVAEVRFVPFSGSSTNAESFGSWLSRLGLSTGSAVGRASAYQAWLGGLDHAADLGPLEFLPRSEGGRFKYRFGLSARASTAFLPLGLISADLVNWSRRDLELTLVEEKGNRMVVEASLPSSSRGFFKLEGPTRGAVAAGLRHSLAIQADGSVRAWGGNSYLQTEVPDSSRTGVVEVAAGWDHSLARTADGSLVAWGRNNRGQTTLPASAQSGVTAIAAGAYHSLAVLSNGSVVAWGYNLWGQSTVPSSALSGVVAVAGGYDHSLALKSGGEVVAWGSNLFGQTSVPASIQGRVRSLAAGGFHSLALLDDGSVVAWGMNYDGQRSVPANASSGVVAVAGGAYFSLALKQDGTVLAWGQDSISSAVPSSVQGSTTALAAGNSHALVLGRDGQITGWGNSDDGKTSAPANLEVFSY